MTMMKETEYRSWFCSYMFYVSSLEFSKSKLYKINLTENDEEYPTCPDTWCKPEECELMQYIGRKDLFGKKVFEGDIIKGSLVVGSHNLPTLGVILYDNIVSQHICKSVSGITSLGRIIDIEVIGNKFETPELLSKDYDE